MDVTNPKSIQSAAALVAGGGIVLDALVNNAGVLLERNGTDLGSIVEPTMSVNVDGVINVTEAFAPLLSEGGHIINVSSGAGTRAAGKLRDAIRAELSAATDGLQLRAIVTRLANEASVGASLERLPSTP